LAFIAITNFFLYLERVLAALESIHKAKWLHLDISPDNILKTSLTGKIDTDGKAAIPVLRLIDLDNARPAGASDKKMREYLSSELHRH
jgi:serine/threonine protein kinase